MSNEEIGQEQEYISMLYGRLDDLRDRASRRLARVFLETGGTPQARSERDSFAGMYSERIAQLDAAENGLCFGRLDFDTKELRYIGRIGLHNDESAEYEPVLLDWRAPAARPFYLATALSPDGVLRRRHIKTRQRRVTGVDDEVLDLTAAGAAGSADGLTGHAGLTGEASLLAALNATRTGRMNDIVETIQVEQDLIIRSPASSVLVVQGGPGTGKTAVALHRAAYLLYTHREQMSKRGVLIVGPNPAFLRYIGNVLPSLGETGVLMSTIGDLYPGISARGTESPEAAEIKGRLAMAGVIAAAVRDRQQVPAKPVELKLDGQPLRLDRQTLRQARDRARRSRRPHNQARPIFVRAVIDALTKKVADSFAADLRESDRRVAEALGEKEPRQTGVLSQVEIDDIRAELSSDKRVRSVLAQLWPVLSPQRLVADLLSSPQRLAIAAPSLTDSERKQLLRGPGDEWTPADVPLIDEAAELLGEDDRAERQRAARERRRRIEYAQGVLDIVSRDLEDDPEVLMAFDMMDADRLAQRQEDFDDRTTAERAAADRTWAFGHIVVDEAQELSDMAWRMLMRRCPSRSLTIAGDIAQGSGLASAPSWEHVLAPYMGTRWRLERLTINYRTPAEIMDVAADVLAQIDRTLDLPTSVRETGHAPWRLQTTSADLPDQAATLAARELAEIGTGTLAVLVPAGRLEEISQAVAAALPTATPPDQGGRDPEDDPGLDNQVVVMTVQQAKGLEFDAVLIADPAAILADSPRGLGDLYVALTRATQRLGVVHPGEPPDVLRRIDVLEPQPAQTRAS
ncbi:MAG TPA: AAA family ATPase [Streptosporangiaceae bacterium]|nr:AAA family ATPase [Streptosporangiaceae bacterium]